MVHNGITKTEPWFIRVLILSDSISTIFYYSISYEDSIHFGCPQTRNPIVHQPMDQPALVSLFSPRDSTTKIITEHPKPFIREEVFVRILASRFDRRPH